MTSCKKPDTVLFDAELPALSSAPLPIFFARARSPWRLASVTTTVGGIFHLGTSFATDGNILTSDINLKTWKSDRDPSLIDLGLIKLKPGLIRCRAGKAANHLARRCARTNAHRIAGIAKKQYWSNNTPIGFVFRMGLIMGLIVGSVVVYQILYSDVSEHLDEYATLKAIGYTDRFLFGLVIQESLILSVLGFLPGLVLSEVVYLIAYRATLLPLRMDPIRALVVYLLRRACASSLEL